MEIDKSGFDKKMKALRRSYENQFPKIVQDAAAYVNSKLVGMILNGATGETYPKNYPAGITEGATGYVGVITSNLRRSIGPEKVDNYTINIRQIYAQLAPYHKYVAAWTQERYTMTFYDIAIKLYGPKVTIELFDFLKQVHKEIDNGKTPTYSNPFPN